MPPTERASQHGFSYLFTLLMVAVLGVGLTVLADLDSLVTRREQEQTLLQIGHEFRQALGRYQALKVGAGTGQYPTRLEDLLLDQRLPGIHRHLRRVRVDPLTGKAEWGLLRVNGRIVGVHSLSTGAPIKEDGFDADDQAFKGARRYRDWVFLHPAARVLPPAPASAASAVIQR